MRRDGSHHRGGSATRKRRGSSGKHHGTVQSIVFWVE